MIPGGDQQQRGGLRSHAIQGHQAWSARGDEGHDEVIQALDLAVQELRAPSQFPLGEAGGLARRAAGPRAQ